ncbi:hypothetical protein FQA39_LY17957 [Lamprigera yunnana]|nr:hypothetical protein FQA39_LY17957 [Lamprigera yunnana]
MKKHTVLLVSNEIEFTDKVSDLDDIRTQSLALSQHIDDIKTVLKHQGSSIHLLLLDETKLLNKYSTELLENLKFLSTKVNNISRAIARVEEEYSVIHQVMESHLINYAAMQLYLYLYQLYNEGLNSCKSGYISEGLINSTYLRTYLILKVEYLSNLGYQFTFSSNDIMKYYNYPIAHCDQHRNQFLLAIAIPLLTLGITQSRFYELRTIPININETIYNLSEITSGLVIENDLDAFYLTEAEYICLDQQSQIKSYCLIRPNVISPVNFNKCLSAIWNGLSVFKYKENCKLIPSNTNAIWMTLLGYILE